jgi:hypothetical protein
MVSPAKCKICRHPLASQVNQAAQRDVGPHTLVRMFPTIGASHMAFYRHLQHTPRPELDPVSEPQVRLREKRARLESLLIRAEQGHHDARALQIMAILDTLDAQILGPLAAPRTAPEPPLRVAIQYVDSHGGAYSARPYIGQICSYSAADGGGWRMVLTAVLEIMVRNDVSDELSAAEKEAAEAFLSVLLAEKERRAAIEPKK